MKNCFKGWSQSNRRIYGQNLVLQGLSSQDVKYDFQSHISNGKPPQTEISNTVILNLMQYNAW